MLYTGGGCKRVCYKLDDCLEILLNLGRKVTKDIQKRIFETIKMELPKDEKSAVVLMNKLNLSQDAVYRRLRGDVPLTIDEIKSFCEAFNISFDLGGTLPCPSGPMFNRKLPPLSFISLSFSYTFVGDFQLWSSILKPHESFMV